MSRTLLFASAAAAAVLALQVSPADAQTAFNWSGFYAGIHGGLLHGDVAIDDDGPVSGTIQGGLFGGLAGINGALSPGLVWSLEGDVGFGDIHGTGVNPLPDAVVDVFRYDFDWNAHIRFRAGVPVGNALPFIAVGAALAQLHVSEYGPSLGGIYSGATIGAGVDFRLGPQLVGRVEGLYDRFSPVTYDDYTVNFSSWTARAALMWRLP